MARTASGWNLFVNLCSLASPKGGGLNVEPLKSTFFDGLKTAVDTSQRVRRPSLRVFVNVSMISGRKFDLRIYTLVTSFCPLKVWLAREGFARLSGELFDLENIDDSRVHLTNMAIQLKIHDDDDKKGELKRGCKWALMKVREYLTARHGAAAVEALFQQIAG